LLVEGSLVAISWPSSASILKRYPASPSRTTTTRPATAHSWLSSLYRLMRRPSFQTGNPSVWSSIDQGTMAVHEGDLGRQPGLEGGQGAAQDAIP